MIKAQPTIDSSSQLRLRLWPVIDLTDDQFFDLCQINRELWIERTAEGDLDITPLRDWRTSWRNAEITGALGNWAKQDESGVAFGSVMGFTLPNTAVRSPDASWVKRSRLLR